MKPLTILILLAFTVIAHASYQHYDDPTSVRRRPVNHRRHSDLSLSIAARKREEEDGIIMAKKRRDRERGGKRKRDKDCKKKKRKKDKKKGDKKKGDKGGSSSSSGNGSKVLGSGNALLKSTAKCKATGKDSGATKEISIDSGPNGHRDFLNCGLETSKGWQPPNVKADELATADFDKALDDPKSPFKPCKPYWSKFKEQAQKNKVPPMLVASIAMQESTCNPKVQGGGGEQGMMQITKDKCKGAPGGDCKDVDFNIRVGVEYLASVLKQTQGNILEAIGKYNGWHRGLTLKAATKAAKSKCCRCQNNADYIVQTLNGWLQNRQGGPLAHYNNLKVCDGKAH